MTYGVPVMARRSRSAALLAVVVALVVALLAPAPASAAEPVGGPAMGTHRTVVSPGATSLRWMARLEQEKLIRLRDDHLDRRRRWVELTDAGVDLMTKYFSGVAPHPIAA